MHIELDKKRILVTCLLFLFVLATFVGVQHNYSMYSTPIGTILKVEEKEDKEKEVAEQQKEDEKRKEHESKTDDDTDKLVTIREKQYTQSMTIKIRNGKRKGEIVTASNTYAFSQIKNEKYHKGDDVFLQFAEDDSKQQVTITNLKRDQYVVVVALIFVIVLILIAGKQGVYTLLTLVINIVLYLLFMKRYIEGVSFVTLSAIMCVVFCILTLLVLGGFHKKSFGAILSSLICVLLITVLYNIVCKFVERPPYEMMDYIIGRADLQGIFTGSVIIGSLGAIMDVAITMNSSISELIATTPQITIKELIYSAREIGYDIMGTMVSVLLFSYITGGMPMFILQLRNGYSAFSIVKYNLYFEATRFLLGSIGIILAIPVSMGIAVSLYYRKGRTKEC